MDSSLFTFRFREGFNNKNCNPPPVPPSSSKNELIVMIFQKKRYLFFWQKKLQIFQMTTID